MHVNARIIAIGGLMLAFTEVCISLGAIIESNTLFLLAAASFLIGIMVREAGLKSGAGFWFAGVLLGMMIAPNKVYVISYAGMGIYILAREVSWEKLADASERMNRLRMFWLIKIIVFNLIYLTGVFVGWNIFISTDMRWQLAIGIIVAGQFGLLIYDMAYEYVQRQIWTKIRKRLL